VPLLVLLDDDAIPPGDEDRYWAAVKEQYGLIAPRREDLKQTNRGTLAQVNGARWDEDSTPMQWNELSFGYFKHADELDWEKGTLYIESVFPYELDADLFLPDDPMFWQGGHLGMPRYSWIEYEVSLSGIGFERSAIELLTGFERGNVSGSSKSRGRAQKWDWAGAMTAVVALANTPDGITQARGEQARIETALAAWFVRETGDQPHPSQLREYATRVMAELAD